jgi:hypothetical protein
MLRVKNTNPIIVGKETRLPENAVKLSNASLYNWDILTRGESS